MMLDSTLLVFNQPPDFLIEILNLLMSNVIIPPKKPIAAVTFPCLLESCVDAFFPLNDL